MSTSNTSKKSTGYKILVQVGMKLYNPQVIAAYAPRLDEDEGQTREIYSKYLRIYPEDSVWEILIKLLIFYLVDGRLWLQASTPMWWSLKREKFRSQLVIQYRPTGDRKRFGYSNYAGNPQLQIPHYDGNPAPELPRYTVGRYSAKYILSDQSYILINAQTQEEAIDVVAKHARYTKSKYRPEGSIEENITITGKKKKPKLDGVKIEPYKAEYLSGTKDGVKSLVRILL
jgi:hypothetical protein